MALRTPIGSHRKRSWTKSPILAVFLVALVVWGGVVVFRTYGTYHDAAELRDQYQNELDQLEMKHGELDQKIKNLSTDNGLEEEIRNRYRVARPGEELVIVVDNATSSANSTTPPSFNFWTKLRGFVGW